MSLNSFATRQTLTVGSQTVDYYSLPALEKAGYPGIARLPFSLKILLENLLRREDNGFVRPADIVALASWVPGSALDKEISFMPARVLLQDFTGVPCVVDLAAMRDGIVRLGGDPNMVNPLQPVVTADVFRRLERRDNPGIPDLGDPLTRPAQLGLWLSETRNDLEPPAIAMVPIIGDLIARLGQQSGCIVSRMSGSGATVFGLFGSSAQAHQAAHDLREKWPGYWVAAAPLIGV